MVSAVGFVMHWHGCSLCKCLEAIFINLSQSTYFAAVIFYLFIALHSVTRDRIKGHRARYLAKIFDMDSNFITFYAECAQTTSVSFVVVENRTNHDSTGT
jgi:hypothetical protein